MLGTWVLSLGVICLLQCTVSGEPRPDFALQATLFGTGRVTGAIGETQLTVADIQANLQLTLTSNYPGLLDLLQLTQEVGGTVTELLEDVLSPLASLAPSSAAADVNLFDAVLGEIVTFRSFLSTRLNAINSQMGSIVRSGALPTQFAESLGRVGSGLQQLTRALQALQSAVTAVLGLSEPDVCSPTTIRPKLVYQVVYAVRTLRAYLPLVTYTLTTTVENIALADQFVVRLTQESQNVQEPLQYVNLITAATSSLNTAVYNAVGTVVTRFNTVQSEVSSFNNLASLMSYGKVVQVMSSFSSTLSQLNSLGPALAASLADIAQQLGNVLVPNGSTPTVNNSDVVATLVRTLIASGPYARYCFYKYEELVFGLANTGLLGVESCVSKEVMRLQQLRTTLLAMVPLLLFDLADFTSELGVCDSTPNATARNDCVDMVADYYVVVANNFRTTLLNLFSTASAEASASKNRLLACVRVLQYQIVDGAAQSLKTDIERCAQNGP
ncbi:uncharacterized protein LOC128715367 [Anopheles marshallii]|uniref:uncharacterized protein LOC128715367 n=1 Tax=Anopheles marshallii TaxID=1521116 RepID=UPI00237B8E87|nr:uncharacterized protein LOC128715367 [Anopheles marshallii]